MSEIIFVENPGDALSLAETMRTERRIISVTAVASEALDRMSIPYEPIGRFADLRQLSAADDRFNRDVFDMAVSLEAVMKRQRPSLMVDGPGFVTGHAYYIQYSVSAIAKRALLMRSAIRALRPTAITLFDTPVDPWFKPDGYRQSPWIQIATQLAADDGLALNVIPERPAAADAYPLLSELVRSPYPTSVRAARMIAGKLWKYGSALSHRRQRSRHRRGRILFGDGFNDYFGPVVRLLVESGIDAYAVTPAVWENTSWAYYYPSYFMSHEEQRTRLAIGRPQMDDADGNFAPLFDTWLSSQPRLDVLDFDVLPALGPQLRRIVQAGPALVRHADAISRRLLDEIRPETVIFSAIPSLPQKRLAHLSLGRGIPVVAYQHAFGYEAQRHASGEQIETFVADYFLTFGPGVQPRTDAVFPVRAKYVSVGSARIEAMRASLLGRTSVTRRSKRVLWVGELSTRNTFVTTLREDTLRHEVQKECLQLLSATDGWQVVFRPYRGSESWDGTVQWLKRRRIPNVRIDTFRRFEDLVVESDLVIIDATSPTTWGETIALERPAILFCDPVQTRVEPGFGEALAQVVEWCRTSSELLQAISRIAADPGSIRQADPSSRAHFLRQYVLGGHSKSCAEDVVAAISNLVAGRRIDDLERPA